MTQGFPLAGIDPTFDYLVSIMAPKKVKYTSTQFEDFAAMKADFERFGVLTINVNHSDDTIFGEASTNWRFRAWHDSQHIEANVDFSAEGERIAAAFQQSQVAALIGPSMRDKQRWIALIDAEVNGQLEYYLAHNSFPVNQRTFVVEYLRDHWGLDANTFPRTLDGLEVRF